MTENYYEHYGQPDPGFVILRVEHTYLNLRVFFTKGCKVNAALLDPNNYQINVEFPTQAFDFGALLVTPEPGVTYPTYVDLTVTDCTGGMNYELEITQGVIESEESTQQDPEFLIGGNKAEFVGVTEDPVVLAVIPLSLSQVKVVFSKYMAQLEPLFIPANYVWTGNVRTLKVEKDTNSSVVLTVTKMVASQIYDLTVG